MIVAANLALSPGPTESSAVSPSSKIFIGLLLHFAVMSSPDLDRDLSSDDGSVQSNSTSTRGDRRSELLRQPRVPTPPPVPDDDAEQDDVFYVSGPE